MSRHVEFIKDPLIELLAIKLYEHALSGGLQRDPEQLRTGWMSMTNMDRDIFRAIARGERPIGREPTKKG